MNFNVKASRTQNSTINEVESISSCNDQDLLSGSKAIHLIQELIDRRSRFMISSQLIHTASQGVDLIDKDDAAVRTSSGCCKELSYPSSTYSYI